ncbi:MAG TPA: hypothetical protein VFR86_24525 [Burkholderiaceae bacterium]|nr:hypothetical protein [Burkholderiaceae bacterium]
MTSFRALSIIGLSACATWLAACKTVDSVDTFKYGFSDVKVNATSTDQPTTNDFHVRSKTWKHEWRCSVLDNCETDFFSTLYVFDKRTGKQVKWNRVEVYLQDGCNASPDDGRNYKTVADTDAVSIGWGEDRKGKYDQVSAFLIFYADWGSVNARVRTKLCP